MKNQNEKNPRDEKQKDGTVNHWSPLIFYFFIIISFLYNRYFSIFYIYFSYPNPKSCSICYQPSLVSQVLCLQKVMIYIIVH